jgi:hypothetical protein
MNLDPVDENVDAGDRDISLVEKNDISLSGGLRRENDHAIADDQLHYTVYSCSENRCDYGRRGHSDGTGAVAQRTS